MCRKLFRITLFLFLSAFLTNTIYAIELPEESLHYDISFLWFKNAAEGKITFAKGDTDNNFTAVLEAETLGFIGFITGYRKYIYISHLSYDGELKRLISTKFERIEIVGSKVWKSVNVMDYYTYKLTWKQLFMEKLLKETVDDIPPGIIYEDILSALFNLRLGFSQHIEKGKDYVIKGVPGKGVVDYFIHVSSPEEEIDRKNKLGIENEDGYLLLVQVPKIIFKSKGTIWIWFTKDLLPTSATVEDAVIFGNITGILRDRVYQNNEI